MRSGVGTFCPRSRRDDFFDDLVRCKELPDLLPGLEAVDFLCTVPCAFAEATHTPSPATKSSVRAGCVAFRRRIWICLVAANSLLLIVRRNFARQIGRQDPVAILPAKNLEYHILAMLEFGNRFAVVGNGGHRFPVDLGNHVTAVEIQIVRERSRIDLGHEHAFLPFHAYAASAVWGEFFHVQAELRRRCLSGLVAHRACRIGEYSGTVSYLGGSFFLRTISHITQFHLTSYRRTRNGIHQIISGLYGMTVYAGNDVAALQAGLLRRTARLHGLNHDAVRRA